VGGENIRWENECERGKDGSGRWEVRVEDGKMSVKGSTMKVVGGR
jgi:hypothetical protein